MNEATLRRGIQAAQFGYHAYRYWPYYSLGYKALSRFGRNTMGGLRGGNLRGTKYVVAGPSLNTKVKRLERLVARQKPETRYFHKNDKTYATILGVNSYEFDLASDLTGWTLFRDNVSGDAWHNLYMKLSLACATAATQRVRIVVYSPKRANVSATSYSPTNSLAAFTHVYDPSNVRILYDKVFVPSSGANPLTLDNIRIRLGYNSIFNSSLTPGVLTDGNIYVRFTFQSTVAAETNRASVLLAFHDK